MRQHWGHVEEYLSNIIIVEVHHAHKRNTVCVSMYLRTVGLLTRRNEKPSGKKVESDQMYSTSNVSIGGTTQE